MYKEDTDGVVVQFHFFLFSYFVSVLSVLSVSVLSVMAVRTLSLFFLSRLFFRIRDGMGR